MISWLTLQISFFFTLNIYLDQVFGLTTTTRCVYDTAAQHVVGGAMDGINGMLFFPFGEAGPLNDFILQLNQHKYIGLWL